jgi:FAD/FMN-containing dehydrogenase
MTRRHVHIDRLRPPFAGDLVLPGSPDYDRARRVWNGTVDRRPAVIARCTGVADVMAALRFARDEDLLVAVRGGGHNVAGLSSCDGGIVVDLGPMKGVRVDPAGRTATAGPGVLWREFDRETQHFGLATPGGAVSDTGIAGLCWAVASATCRDGSASPPTTSSPDGAHVG